MEAETKLLLNEANANKTLKNHAVTNKNICNINKLTKDEREVFVKDFIEQINKKLNEERILVIDRFENNFAVCEDRETGEMINIQKEKLPENVQESDVLMCKNGTYKIDEEKRNEIEERINNKIRNLFND